MRIAVIGAGIIGITTAYELACDGHEVKVFEQRSAAAEESSFANAGLIAPGYLGLWSEPGIAIKAISQVLTSHPTIRFGMPLTLHDLGWIWKCFRASTPVNFKLNCSRLHQFALYSQRRLAELKNFMQLEYDHSAGCLVLFRSEKERLQIQSSLDLLRATGTPFQEVSAGDARKLEPALNADTFIHCAVNLPSDGVGNCRQFALLLKNEAQRLGVNFFFNHVVTSIDTQHGTSLHIENDPIVQDFDAIVVCAGVNSANLLVPLDLKVPLSPVYGYSVSAAVREPLNAPRSAIMDQRYKATVSRLGNRVRVAGGAEIGGTPNKHSLRSIKTLYKVLQEWFPGAARLSNEVQVWKGARPMLSDGLPLIGHSGIPGVWLNLGHGSHGWALSCGSARAVADLIQTGTSQTDLDGFNMSRFNT
jgi:D-amino-acid dehydrogenase